MTKFSRLQRFNKTNIEKIPIKKAIVYELANREGKNLYTGVSKIGSGQERLTVHKEVEKEKIPGATHFRYALVKNKKVAAKIERQIIKKEEPPFNKQNK